MKFLTLLIGQRPYGLPIGLIREIIEDAHVTPVEKAAADVIGLMNVRGQIVTVLYPGAHFDAQLNQKHPDCRVIILKRNDDLSDAQKILGGQNGTATDLYAFFVEGIEEVFDISMENISKMPSNALEAESHFLMGIARQEGRIIPILHVNRLILPVSNNEADSKHA